MIQTPKCVVCQSVLPTPFLDLGSLPLGNALLATPESPDPHYPLRLSFCSGCKTVQQFEPPPLDALVQDYRDYKYVPVGDSLRSSLRQLGIDAGRIAGEGLVVDLGANDGTLLAGARDAGAKVYGVEPGRAIAEAASHQHGIEILPEFFDQTVATFIRGWRGPASVVTMTQTLQHVPDPVSFLRAAASMLTPNGCMIIEGRYFRDTMDFVSYDTIYHEMLTFPTVSSLSSMLAPVGFAVVASERVNTHGGSVRVMARRLDMRKAYVVELEDSEISAGLLSFETYREFGQRVAAAARSLGDRVRVIAAGGARIVGYGSPSTSVTLLGSAGLGRDHLLAICDDNPRKVGLFHPHTKIPIISTADARKLQPTHLFILPRQFSAEIRRQTADWGVTYV